MRTQIHKNKEEGGEREEMFLSLLFG
jgi:hypothetical protein